MIRKNPHRDYAANLLSQRQNQFQKNRSNHFQTDLHNDSGFRTRGNYFQFEILFYGCSRDG